MPTLSLGGQTLATQTGSDAPVLGSVTLNSTQSFPAGMIVKTYQAIFCDPEFIPGAQFESKSD